MSLVINHNPIFETLTPAPGGGNKIFHFSKNYVSNSVSIWVDGIFRNPNLDTGYTLLGGDSIELKQAPSAWETVQGSFDQA